MDAFFHKCVTMWRCNMRAGAHIQLEYTHPACRGSDNLEEMNEAGIFVSSFDLPLANGDLLDEMFGGTC